MKVALFDFDGTLFPHETIPFLIKQFPKLGYPRRKQWWMMARLVPDLLKYKLSKNPDKEAFRHQAVYRFLSMFEGMTQEAVDGFFVANVPTVLSLLDPELVAEVVKCHSEGYHTVLLSGCFDMLLNPLAKHLDIDEVIGTSLVFTKYKDDQLRMKSSAPITIISGEDKMTAARTLAREKQVDWSASKAYADSYYDAPMLALVGHKHAVNPDVKLEAIAKREGWDILRTDKGRAKVNYSN